ncbi:unnamed protein product [Acanthoscelides obtectus]|uniref:Uncharacterized protein n=1 Tax=Acanthoscelides obtectus TaxID=200917 RepID=A0A9P0JUN6_ACAOB|nr:unnamed protein product [Acanthoscelides obtectus]CAK1625492.1 hypothetical protein AOBTE_LOCUS3194 [Acanthoscelides obtectus]
MDLFEKEGGWIITKNQKGKVKLAACSEDESNIYEKSRDWVEVAADSTKLNTFRPRQRNSVATLFIRDLLNSERKDSYFEMKIPKHDILYRKVFICGTVVELNTRTAKHSIGIGAMVLSKMEDLKKCIPEVKDLTLGDIVKLTGNMSEYNGLRYVFIKSIAKEPKGSTFYDNHMEYLVKLYAELIE